jgi:replicative DNA helicase
MQTEICALAMWDHDFLRRTDGLIRPEYFTDEIESGFIRLTLDFYAKHREAPSKTAWVQLLKDGFLAKPPVWRNDLKADVVQKLADTQRMTIRSRSFILDKVAEFAKQQALLNGLIAAADAIDKMHDPDRFKKIEQVLSGAFKVGLRDSDEDYDFFERIEERHQARMDLIAGAKPRTGITTGIAELDDLLEMHGGWGRKELSLFMGAAKASKSFNLTSSAAAAVLAGYDTLFITLENAREVQARRIEAYMAEVAMSNFLRTPHAVKSNMDAIAASEKRGRLHIREFPMHSFRPKDLERLIDEYKAKGIVFDLVVIDYLDVMAPDSYKENTIEASREIYGRCRGVAQAEGFALVSATQTNREGAKAATAQMTHVAEDFNRIRIADIVISINRTEEERTSGKARLYIAAARNQRDGVTLFVKQDLDMGRAVAAVEAVE